MRRLLLALALACALCPAGRANDAETQQRIRNLEETLRCLVCQNQTLADSGASLAEDLRREVREQVAAGKSDEQIKQYLVARYGDFVLYDPPFKASTALLWAGPFLLLALGVGVLVAVVRRRRRAPEEPALAETERRLVERVLGPGDRRAP